MIEIDLAILNLQELKTLVEATSDEKSQGAAQLRYFLELHQREIVEQNLKHLGECDGGDSSYLRRPADPTADDDGDVLLYEECVCGLREAFPQNDLTGGDRDAYDQSISAGGDGREAIERAYSRRAAEETSIL